MKLNPFHPRFLLTTRAKNDVLARAQSNLPIIQSLWLNAPLSNLEKLCIQSFLAHGHEFHLYVYDEVAGVPDGAQVKDANEILPQENIFLDGCNTITGFSDWFRWAVLAKKGGFWTDTDVVCLAPFRFTDTLVAAYEGFGTTPGTAVLGGNDPLFQILCDACRDYPAPQPWDTEGQAARKIRAQTEGHKAAGWGGVGGPVVLQAALTYFQRHGELKSRDYFYPISWDKRMSVFDETYARQPPPFTEHTHALHLWNAALRNKGVDKNADFPRGALFSQLQRRYKMHRRWWNIFLPR